MSAHADEGAGRHMRRMLRFLNGFRVVAVLDLTLGLCILGYASVEGFTGHLLRGGLMLVAIGAIGLVQARAWRRKLESPA